MIEGKSSEKVILKELIEEFKKEIKKQQLLSKEMKKNQERLDQESEKIKNVTNV